MKDQEGITKRMAKMAITLDRLSPEEMVEFLLNQKDYTADLNDQCKLIQCATYIQVMNEALESIKKSQ